MGVTPLEFIIVVLSCPVMHIVFHISGSITYQTYAVNFIQYFLCDRHYT